MVARSVCPRCRRTLRYHHNQTRAGDGKEGYYVSPTQIRQTQMGQASGHGSENGDTALSPMKDGARRDCPRNRKESPGKPGGNAMAEHNSGHHNERNLHRQEVSVGQRSKHFEELNGSMTAVD